MNLFQDISGNDISIQGMTIGSGSPKIYIQGGTHGGEITFFIIENIYKRVIDQYKSGTITLVPISNPISWSQRVYSNTLGKFSFQDGKDWNRGYDQNDESLSGIRRAKIMNLLEDYDYMIDLHTSRRSIPFGIFTKENLDEKVIKAVGMKYNYLISTHTDTSMMSVLSKRGKVAFEIECGSHDSVEIENITDISNRIGSFLSSLGIISGEKIEGSSQLFSFSSWDTYFAPISGFLHSDKELGTLCKKNSALCESHTFSSSFEKCIINARSDFILMKKLHTNIIWKGDEVFQGVAVEKLVEVV